MLSKVHAVKTHITGKKALYILIAKLVISAGLITFIIYKVNINEVIGGIQNANLFLIGVCSLLLLLNLYLQLYKWRICCNEILKVNDNFKILSSLFYGLSAGAFTPARLGEYWGRSIAFKDTPFLKVSAATVVDKLFPMVIVLFTGVIASIFFTLFITGNEYSPAALSVYIIFFIVVILLLFFRIKQLKKDKILALLQRFSFVRKNPDLIDSIVHLSRKFFVKMSTVSAIFYLCYIIQFALLAAAFSNNYSLATYIWAGFLIMFSKTILGSFSLSELGIRESASVYFLTSFGETAATGFNAAFFLFIINVIVPSIIGLFLMLTRQNGK